MQAIKISLFIMCVVASMGVLNSLGIMDVQQVPANAQIDVAATQSIMEVNSSSDAQINNNLFGWGAIAAAWSGLMSMLYMIFLPGVWLTSHGCNVALAGAIQLACNASFVLLALQVFMKFGLRGTI
jgi:hypothetical protein